MASVVEIGNLALSHIRAGTINSLTEASVQAQQVSLLYPILRDQVLQDAPWQFARKVQALALRTDELFNWVYAYQYPSDCIKIRRLIINFEEINSSVGVRSRFYDPNLAFPGVRDKVKYQIQNVNGDKVIAANEMELRAEYTVKVEDPNLFDPQFILGLSHLLAAHLAVPLVGTDLGAKLQRDMLSIYRGYIDSATAADLNEQFQEQPDSDFITIR